MTPEAVAAIAALKPAVIAVIEAEYDGVGRVWLCKTVIDAQARVQQCLPLSYPIRSLELVLFNEAGEEIERFCEW